MSAGNLVPCGSPSPRTPYLLLWIHTKITIAYPSRIFKSTIFHAPSRFSYLLSKKGKALLEEALQIQQGHSALLPGGPPEGKALPPSSGGTTLADCRVTFPPAGGCFPCGFPRSTRPASGTAFKHANGLEQPDSHHINQRADQIDAKGQRHHPQEHPPHRIGRSKGQAVPQHIVPHQGMHMDNIHPRAAGESTAIPFRSALLRNSVRAKKHSRATALITMKGET